MALRSIIHYWLLVLGSKHIEIERDFVKSSSRIYALTRGYFSLDPKKADFIGRTHWSKRRHFFRAFVVMEAFWIFVGSYLKLGIVSVLLARTAVTPGGQVAPLVAPLPSSAAVVVVGL